MHAGLGHAAGKRLSRRRKLRLLLLLRKRRRGVRRSASTGRRRLLRHARRPCAALDHLLDSAPLLHLVLQLLLLEDVHLRIVCANMRGCIRRVWPGRMRERTGEGEGWRRVGSVELHD